MNNFSLEDIEDIVLGMADIVNENRYLRRECKRLKDIEDKYHRETLERIQASEQATINMMNALFAGYEAGITAKDRE